MFSKILWRKSNTVKFKNYITCQPRYLLGLSTGISKAILNIYSKINVS